MKTGRLIRRNAGRVYRNVDRTIQLAVNGVRIFQLRIRRSIKLAKGRRDVEEEIAGKSRKPLINIVLVAAFSPPFSRYLLSTLFNKSSMKSRFFCRRGPFCIGNNKNPLSHLNCFIIVTFTRPLWRRVVFAPPTLEGD